MVCIQTVARLKPCPTDKQIKAAECLIYLIGKRQNTGKFITNNYLRTKRCEKNYNGNYFIDYPSYAIRYKPG
ncbi:MAG: hypothetical protein HW390_755 [Candidatus Brocadiaceae bacterium]|nr:hypothetical protein [Candidatus Brocadiaceae bacterium]